MLPKFINKYIIEEEKYVGIRGMPSRSCKIKLKYSSIKYGKHRSRDEPRDDPVMQAKQFSNPLHFFQEHDYLEKLI